MQGLLEKSKLGQDAYEGGHKVCAKEGKVLWIETNIFRNTVCQPTSLW